MSGPRLWLGALTFVASASCLLDGGPVEQTPWCARYVRCQEATAPRADLDRFREGGACWRSGGAAASCDADCREEMRLVSAMRYPPLACTTIEPQPVQPYPPLPPPGPCSAPRRLPWPGYLQAVADLNADGIPDLVTVDTATSHWRTRIGDGSGRFDERLYDAAGNAIGLEIVDVDGDGALDVVIFNRPGSTGFFAVYFGDGDGGFGEPAVSGGFAGNAFALADFDGDGTLDVVLPRPHATGAYEIAFGRGDGTFGTPIPVVGVHIGTPIAVDLDGDGAADLVHAANEPGAALGIAMNDGTGRFTLHPGGDTSLDLIVGLHALVDLDGDGALDLVASGPPDRGREAIEYVVLWGDGDGAFGDETTLEQPGAISSVAIEDVDGDGTLDVLMTGPGVVSVAHGMPGRAFGALQITQVDGRPLAALPADLDLDGVLDLVVPKLEGLDLYFACRDPLRGFAATP